MQVTAGASLQTAINNNPAGAVFCLAAGTWTGQTISPKANQQFIGALGPADQRLSIIDGNGATRFTNQISVDGVVFKNLVVTDYAPPIQQCMVGGGGYSNALYENLEVSFAAHCGIQVGGDGATLRNSWIHHNGQIGVKANRGSGDIVKNVLIEGNEINNNNPDQKVWPGIEGGGTKFLHTLNLTVRGNNVHNNCGPGLWTDHNNFGTLYENNTVIRNAGAGIFHEISGSAVIRNNYLEGNALGIDNNPACTFASQNWGIYISSSHDVEAYGNVLVGNEGGIGSQQENRVTFKAWIAERINVHNNDITLQVGWTGHRFVSGTRGDESTINFEGNAYDVPTTSGQWWMFNGLKTWAQWQALGHDDTGSVR